MTTCETGSGNCGICCPGACNCIEIVFATPTGANPAANPGPEPAASGEGGCECWCRGAAIPRDFLRQITEHSRLNYNAHGMPLGEIGAIFACAFPGEIFVPAENVYAPVTLDLKNVTVAELFERVGLVRQPPKYR